VVHRYRTGSRRKRRVAKATYVIALTLAVLVSATGYRAASAAGEPATVLAGRDQRTRQFDIPAQPLDQALAAFTRQSGLEVQAAGTLLRGRNAAAVTGTYTPAEALQRLLGDAPLRVRIVDNRTLALDDSAAPNTIGRVNSSGSAYTATRAGLGKYTQSLLDTPQTIVEVPAQVMADQNATTLHDALRNVSGISLAAGEGGSQGDSLTIRGFDAKDDFYLDGMRDFGNYYRDPFNLQRVEVIMGPASMLLGHGEGGGIVNQVSKTPVLGNFADITLTAGSDNLQRFTIDDNQQLGSSAAFRINGMAETTNTAGRDVTMGKRLGLAPSVTFGLNTPNRLTISLYGQSDDAIPDYGLPYINDRPAQVPRSNFYGFADGDRLEDDVAIGTIAFDHDFSDNFTLHSQLRVAYYERSFGASDALTPSPQPLPGTPLQNITVARTQHSRNGNESFFQSQTYLTRHIGAQTLMFGYEATRETSHETSNSVTGLPSTNLLNPNPYQPFSYTSIAARSDNHTTADTLALFAADSIKLGRYFEFDAGLRFDTFAAQNAEYVSQTTAAQDVRKLSPQAALVYKPVPNGSFYIGYDTSFQPSADALSLTSAQIVAPASNVTYEAGTKWSLLGQHLNVSAAIFNSILNNAHITEPDGSVLPVGKERSNGFQMQIQGNLAPHWRLTGGYTLLETSVLAYALATQPNIVGTHIPNAPTGSASLWTTYAFPHFEVGLGVSGLSQRQASIGVDAATGAPILVPGYMRADAEFKYPFSKSIALQLNAYNLLDKYYFDELHPDHVVPGAGRSIELTLSIKTGR
jgi:catecholate siderophore receptor